ncbi:MAG: hypothetical protein Q9200_004380 [Gallowayella weberi]
MSVANEALPPAANYEDSHDSSVAPEIITSPEAHILPSYTCNGTSLGYNLNGPSCLQAWAQIPLLNTERSFGPRPPKGQRLQWDVGLPLRYLSRGDGNLFAVVRKFNAKVECTTPVSVGFDIKDSCQRAIDTMKAAQEVKNFGLTSGPGSEPRAILPYYPWSEGEIPTYSSVRAIIYTDVFLD